MQADLSTYALVAVWHSEEEAQQHLQGLSYLSLWNEFSQELFARFNIMDARGTYKGFSAKQMTNAKTQS